ncbi:type VI secretion system tip protein VgrG [Cyclobacterium marinum]|uniref:type VI secretion system tip protein VgrG n=1 Tax=Cyclobacterium marinum TaxID=104 RepID=UPI0011EE66D4|nr:type VI secretion system tip protein VgrG [Cyclobacterium marinum]MBI0398299.1 type VI secretion system tip protein VgrG [Cyclobacterium marinum]
MIDIGDIVTVTVKVSGSELPDTVQIINVLVHRELNRIPYAKIVMLDGDPSSGNFPLSNEATLLPGSEIEILAGYNAEMVTIFKGSILNHKIKIRDRGAVLVIDCKDKAFKMASNRKSGYFYDLKDSDLIEELISRNGLEASVSTSNYTHPEVIQYQCSDWDFLVARAQANGMVVNVENGKIHVTKPDPEQSSIRTVQYGVDIMEFDAEMDGRNQVPGVTSFGWNPTDQEMIKVEANKPGFNLNGNLSPDELADMMALDPVDLKNGGKIADALLQDWADSKWMFQQLAKTRGRVKIQGNSEPVPGQCLSLSGVGNRFSGNTFVSGVRHQIAEGNWTMDVQFGMDPEWFTEQFSIDSQPASGLLAAVKGLQVGLVSQLEGDPDGEDRIMVKFPVINADEQGVWCRLSSLDAGKERGFAFRPEIGDEVIIGFINEDPNQGVVLGMLHSSSHPSHLELSDDNHQKGYVSRSGIKVMFDDDLKKLEIETPAGKKIVMDEDGDSINITDDHGNSITMNGEGIAMESGSDMTIKSTGDINIEGVNINIKSQAELKAEASAAATLSSSGTTTIKGSLIQIN